MRAPTAFTLTAAAALLSACGGAEEGAENRSGDSGQLAEAPAVPMVNASGAIIGQVRGGDSEGGATLLIEARGLPPGVHGIHIHDVGLCEPPGFTTAGSHWNPTGAEHGGDNPKGAHMGDLQNVTVADDGTLRVQVVAPGTYLRTAGRDANAGARQILDASGASIVIHAKPDDQKTDPSGNSGDRIACAVLGSPEPGAEAMMDVNSAATAGNSVANTAANSGGNESEAEPPPPPPANSY
ncbi:MAG TPA: superoxide dismutase family protein [Sphingomicrobium sp.]|nr:superoxide dismutase family protein [Sphingomicrobium sp.]